MEYKTFKIGDFETKEPADLNLTYNEKHKFFITSAIKTELSNFYDGKKDVFRDNRYRKDLYDNNLYPGIFKFLFLTELINNSREKINFIKKTLFTNEDINQHFQITLMLLQDFDNNLNLLLKMGNSSLKDIEDFLSGFTIKIEIEYIKEQSFYLSKEDKILNKNLLLWKNLSFFFHHSLVLNLEFKKYAIFKYGFINNNSSMDIEQYECTKGLFRNWKRMYSTVYSKLNEYLNIINYKQPKYKIMSNLKSIPKKEDYVNDKILYKHDNGDYTIFTKKEVELILKKNPVYQGTFISLKKIDEDFNILNIINN